MEKTSTPKKIGRSIPPFYSEFHLEIVPSKKHEMLWTYSNGNSTLPHGIQDVQSLTDC